MSRGTAMLLAPHASRLHPLTAANPLHVAVLILAAAVFLFFLWTVTTPNPRRSR